MAGAVVRPEGPGDRPAVAKVVADAFRSEALAAFVDAIRSSSGFVPELSLVAELEGRVVGHVMISQVGIEGTDGSRAPVPSLSPLAVAPDEQGRGIGGALVRAVTAAAEGRGEVLVVLEGNPRYYGRFGFVPAASHGIEIDLPSWASPEAAQVLLLGDPDAPRPTGKVVYPPAFALVADE